MGEAKRRRRLGLPPAQVPRLRRLALDLSVDLYDKLSTTHAIASVEHEKLVGAALSDFAALMLVLGLKTWTDLEAKRRQEERRVVDPGSLIVTP